ncbi:MAG: GNAT family N-acetyltransferase [Planctomycetes bacterium]|nr:GNAT family N-acetyltransferase [Planctomycetota bacterium]
MSFSIQTAGDDPVLRNFALTLLYRHLPLTQRERQVAEMLDLVNSGNLSLQHLLVAIEHDRLLGTVLAVPRPGGAAFLWPPVVAGGDRSETVAMALLEELGRRVDAQNILFTQCLLDPSDEASRQVLHRGGMPRLTELLQLSRPLPGQRLQGNPVPFTCETYSDATHSAFVKVIDETYIDTLDCPPLAQIRSGELLLEAHRATGEFRPEACRIFRQAGRDIGVLLLAEHPDRDVWEVSYLGIVPAARGNGFGREILSLGIHSVQNSGRRRMEIAVDLANKPALQIYHSLGFTDVCRYAVHLRFLPSARS